MSTGENINANGSMVTDNLLHFGFNRFPQTTQARIAENLWPVIQNAQIAAGYPFAFVLWPSTPANEIWFVDGSGTLLGRIIHLSDGRPPAGVSNIQITAATLTQKGQNYTVNATYTDTPNLSTTWTIWTGSAKDALENFLSTVLDQGTQVNGTGSYSVTSNFKANPHIPVYFTVIDAANGEVTKQLA